MKTVLFLLLLWIGSASSAFVITEGKCPDVSAQRSLKFERYMGRWYEYMRFPSPLQPSLQCTSAHYEQLSDGSVKVVNDGYIRAELFNRNFVLDRWVAEGFADVPDPKKLAEFSVSFPPLDSKGQINYRIIRTDYHRTAVVHSCYEIWNANIQFAWILTRERGVRPRNLDRLFRELTNYGVDISNFITVDQRNCPTDTP
ncbi:apolipoprotein D [Elysia marginata]|uniref:Apolipoprotein D n=1 Tax=Elysia marginata TaxID=1093978 RepID=A0AAV4EL15_9GAST|nr:apolipoprotein D [Elysia marginata]